MYPKDVPQPFLSFKDYCTWFPNTTLTDFQKNEEDASFFIADTKKDLKVNKTGEIITWFSKSKSNENLNGKILSKKFVSMAKGFALTFDKTYYTILNSAFIIFPGYGYLCITFCTNEEKKQVLLTNYTTNSTITTTFNEIVVSRSTVSLIGFDKDKKQKEVNLEHDCTKYTTLFIEWIIVDDSATGYLWINNKRKKQFSFTQDYVSNDSIDVGMREDHSFPFKGNIGALEIYHKIDRNEKINGIPDAVRDLIINNQMSLSLDE